MEQDAGLMATTILIPCPYHMATTILIPCPCGHNYIDTMSMWPQLYWYHVHIIWPQLYWYHVHVATTILIPCPYHAWDICVTRPSTDVLLSMQTVRFLHFLWVNFNYLRHFIAGRYDIQFNSNLKKNLPIQNWGIQQTSMPYLTGMCMWLTSLKIYKLLSQDRPCSSKCSIPVVCGF